MNLKQDFLLALRDGVDHDSLLDLVHDFVVRGVAPRQAYDILQEIWLDFGYNDSEEESNFRDNLEYVMEKIWYESPPLIETRK